MPHEHSETFEKKITTELGRTGGICMHHWFANSKRKPESKTDFPKDDVELWRGEEQINFFDLEQRYCCLYVHTLRARTPRQPRLFFSSPNVDSFGPEVPSFTPLEVRQKKIST